MKQFSNTEIFAQILAKYFKGAIAYFPWAFRLTSLKKLFQR